MDSDHDLAAREREILDLLAGLCAAPERDELRIAAFAGDAAAQRNLGVMYERGRGVPQDYREAAKWFLLAAHQGDAAAQNNLGAMYFYGHGVPVDYVRAYAWLNLAATQGDKLAAKSREDLLVRMTPAQINEAQDLSRALWR